MKEVLDFVHEFVPGSSKRTLLLLHGTGGNEHDLISLGREIDPTAAILSPRGKVLENGMPRFFRRLAEGIFDEEDLKKRTHELADFVGAAAQHYEFAAESRPQQRRSKPKWPFADAVRQLASVRRTFAFLKFIW
jgi:phospholipase/carboxylesterase